MQTAAVREALESIGGEASSWGAIRPVDAEGGSYFTFDVEPGCIFRFPRDDASADALRREIRLLPELADRVSFAVPRIEWTGRTAGRPFAGYRRIPGRALQREDLAIDGPAPAQGRANARERVAQVLAELHGFPKRRASALLGVTNAIGAWSERQLAMRAAARERVLPLLDAGLRGGVERAFDRFFADGLPYFLHPVLVHGDLGCEHILVDDTGLCTGLIDFEEATVGDPVIDFVGLWITHGREVTGDVLARYGGPQDAGFGERLHFYHWLGAVHAIVHGLETGDDPLVASGIGNLGQRIERSALGDALEI